MPFPNDPEAPAAATQPRIATSSAVRTVQSVAQGVAWRTSRLRDGFRRAAVPCPAGEHTGSIIRAQQLHNGREQPRHSGSLATDTGRGILRALRPGRSELRRCARHCDGAVLPASGARALGSVAARGPLAVVAAGLLVVR